MDDKLTYLLSRLVVLNVFDLCMLGTENFYFFFFQAEDGIRDLIVTGVQTCALPILSKKSCN